MPMNTEEKKKRRGRPAGSKNTKTGKRGRPPGSKNKIKSAKPVIAKGKRGRPKEDAAMKKLKAEMREAIKTVERLRIEVDKMLSSQILNTILSASIVKRKYTKKSQGRKKKS